MAAPRKNALIRRLGLRLPRVVRDEFDKFCDRHDMTQRAVVEAAIAEKLAERPEFVPVKLPRDTRTALWIDPALIAELDHRLEVYGGKQGDFIEDAIRQYVAKHS